MNDIKDRVLNHFFTRKRYFILGKPVLNMRIGKDIFNIFGDATDGVPKFKIDHGVTNHYFNDVDQMVEFLEKFKE